MPVGFIEIIIVGAIAAGLVLLLAKDQNRGRIARFMGFGLAIGMVVALVLLTLRSHFSAVRTTQQEWRHAEVGEVSTLSEGDDGPAWEPTEQMLQFAATHPSVQEAAEAAISRLAEDLTQPPSQVELVVQQRSYPAGRDVEGGVMAALRERFPQASIVRVSATGPDRAPATQPANPSTWRVRLSVPDITVQRSGTGQAWMMQLTSETATGPLVASASVEEKPWARRGNTHMTMNGREFIVGWSTRAATAPGDAMQQARESAARALHATLSAKLRDYTDPRGRSVDDAWLLARLRAEAHPVDRFEQRIDRPAGTLWRTAILVDATPARLETMALQIRSDLNRLESRQLGLYASIAILVALIFGLYMALNALTRGYFANRLRLLAACLLLAGVILIMLLA